MKTIIDWIVAVIIVAICGLLIHFLASALANIIFPWYAFRDREIKVKEQMANIEWHKTIHAICNGQNGYRNGSDIVCQIKE
jgi:hypothetical protein